MPTISRPLARRRPPTFPGDPKPQRDIAYEYRRSVGRWVKDTRLSHNLRQEDVAQVLGVGFSAISGIETGRLAVPPERYAALADLFGVDHKEFGLRMLRGTNPWCYAMIFGPDADATLAEDLKALPDRAAKRAPKATPKTKR